jgi:hypothetical protein
LEVISEKQGEWNMAVPEKQRKFSTSLFQLTMSILVGLVAFKVVYIVFIFGLIPFLPESSILTPIALFVGFTLSVFSGIMCFRWLYAYFRREYYGT